MTIQLDAPVDPIATLEARIAQHEHIYDAPIINVVSRALAALGTTPDEVAQTLRDAGIRATMCTATDCALARFVASLDAVKTGGYSVAIGWDGGALQRDGVTWCVANTGAIRDFILRFDNGAYPELVE